VALEDDGPATTRRLPGAMAAGRRDGLRRPRRAGDRRLEPVEL